VYTSCGSTPSGRERSSEQFASAVFAGKPACTAVSAGRGSNEGE